MGACIVFLCFRNELIGSMSFSVNDLLLGTVKVTLADDCKGLVVVSMLMLCAG